MKTGTFALLIFSTFVFGFFMLFAPNRQPVQVRPTRTPQGTPPPPTPTFASTPAPTPAGDNLFINGDFGGAARSFEGWDQLNGWWTAPPAGLHGPICGYTTSWLQAGRDKGANGWPDPDLTISEDWAWTTFESPAESYSGFVLSYLEIHHFHVGETWWTFYGSNDELSWTPLYFHEGTISEPISKKCQGADFPVLGVFPIPVGTPYAYYKFEVYAKLTLDDADNPPFYYDLNGNGVIDPDERFDQGDELLLGDFRIVTQP